MKKKVKAKQKVGTKQVDQPIIIDNDSGVNPHRKRKRAVMSGWEIRTLDQLTFPPNGNQKSGNIPARSLNHFDPDWGVGKATVYGSKLRVRFTSINGFNVKVEITFATNGLSTGSINVKVSNGTLQWDGVTPTATDPYYRYYIDNADPTYQLSAGMDIQDDTGNQYLALPGIASVEAWYTTP